MVTEPNLVVKEPLDELAVTVPLIAGSDAIVTLFDMDAVTEPIWAVPAPRVTVPSTTFTPIPPAPANSSRLLYPPPIKDDMLPTFAVTVPEMTGREPIVTELPIVTDAIETGWVAGKLEMETAEKVTACDAGKLEMVMAVL